MESSVQQGMILFFLILSLQITSIWSYDMQGLLITAGLGHNCHREAISEAVSVSMSMRNRLGW